jgi:hypothetical protein
MSVLVALGLDHHIIAVFSIYTKSNDGTKYGSQGLALIGAPRKSAHL